MFIGHFGVGFGLKRFAPRVSLAVLIGAALWADILWTVFLLLGWEHVRIAVGDTKWTPLDLYDYPWSHSLAMMLVWAAALGLAYRLWRKDAAGGWVVAIGVVSHWVLDWITHRPDMPLYSGGPKFGLALWKLHPRHAGRRDGHFPRGSFSLCLLHQATRQNRPLGILVVRRVASFSLSGRPFQCATGQPKGNCLIGTHRHDPFSGMALVVRSSPACRKTAHCSTSAHISKLLVQV